MRNFVVLATLGLAVAGCQTPAQRAAADEKACADMGAPKGSSLYFQCRMFKEQQQAKKDEDFSNNLLALSAMYNQPTSRRLETTCTSSRVGMYVQTDCN